MFKIKKMVYLVLVLALLAFVFVGCSPAEDEADGSLDRIVEAGEIIFVGSGGYPPFNFYDEDQVMGFDVDTGAAIAERLGVEMVYETSDWDGLPDGLRAGRYDAILGSMGITEEREKIVSFTTPYYYSGAQLIVREDSGFTGPDDMDGKDIGVITGETYVDDALGIGANDIHYSEVNQVLLEVIGGRIDGMITDRVVAVNGMNEINRGDELMLAGELMRTEVIAIAVRQEDNELREAINAALEEMHADGTMTAISMEWFGEDITKQ